MKRILWGEDLSLKIVVKLLKHFLSKQYYKDSIRQRD